MLLKISNDGQYIKVDDLQEHKTFQLLSYMTAERKDAFILRKLNPNIPVEESFMSENLIVSSGLWRELYNFASEYKEEVVLSDAFLPTLIDTQITKEYFEKYVSDLFEGSEIQPYGYQKDAAYAVLRYRRCVAEMSTSAGKTLTSYLIFKYMLDHLDETKMVFVVPSGALATQTMEKFVLYDGKINPAYKKEWKYELVGGGKPVAKFKGDKCNIVFGTFQSLQKVNVEFFRKVTAIVGDECQHITASGMQVVFSRCVNARYKIGLSGTPHKKKGTIESFTSQSYMGPIVYTLTSDKLINEEKKATPIEVEAIELVHDNTYGGLTNLYNHRMMRPAGDTRMASMLYNEEREYIRASHKRLEYICNCIASTDMNTLVLFSDVKGDYGNQIVKWLEENTDKTIYYVDGSTSVAERDAMKEEFEKDETNNSVFVATLGTFSEGVDLLRLWYIFLVETTKSERIVAQALGRGMRLFKGKEKVILYDFRDNLNYKPKGEKVPSSRSSCYLMKHAKERDGIYKDRKFPLTHKKVYL